MSPALAAAAPGLRADVWTDLAAGFSGHGFGIGPGAGRLISELAMGKTPFVDHTQYTLARLNKGVWGKVSDF